MSKKYLSLLCLLVSFVATHTAQATLYQITAVLDGSSDFFASSFHDSSGIDPTDGPTRDEIVEVAGIYGTYNDVTGVLNASNMSLAGGGSFTLQGILSFTVGGGALLSPATVDVAFTGALPSLFDTTIGINPGYVCCGSTDQDPNSFVASGGNMIMTLWGADFTGGSFNGSYPGSQIGLDIRLQMSEVPVPAAVWLFGSALIGLAGIKRKK